MKLIYWSSCFYALIKFGTFLSAQNVSICRISLRLSDDKDKESCGNSKECDKKVETVITSAWRHTAWIGDVSLSTTEWHRVPWSKLNLLITNDTYLYKSVVNTSFDIPPLCVTLCSLWWVFDTPTCSPRIFSLSLSPINVTNTIWIRTYTLWCWPEPVAM